MRFHRYGDSASFGAETREILLENEAQNNLQIRFIEHGGDMFEDDWMLATVKDDNGGVVLTAVCTPPFDLVLYETRNRPDDAAIRLLADELKALGYAPPGVLAEKGVALRFAEAYAPKFSKRMSMVVMQLDSVADIKKAPGYRRTLHETDMFFAPYWLRSFGEECHVEVYDIQESSKRLRNRLGKSVHFIWEDGVPVSQAVHGLSTVNGAVINEVYTPPDYRGRGYATSVVAELAESLLDGGNKFCCLFADESNPVSRGIYRKIGFYDVCVFDKLTF